VDSVTPSSTSVYRRWVLFCTIGELVGFGGIPVLGSAIAFWATTGIAADLRSIIFYVIAVIGGFGEGAVLAWFQLRVVGACLPRLNGYRWILATGIAASIAWILGFLAPTLDDLFGLSAQMQIAIWVPGGVLILLSIGTAQAIVLRGIVARPQRWIAANAIGWLLGLAWTFALPAMVPETAPIIVWATTFVIAGLLMGLTVGLVTGHTLVRFTLETEVRGTWQSADQAKCRAEQ
jgi:hypothetical protein